MPATEASLAAKLKEVRKSLVVLRAEDSVLDHRLDGDDVKPSTIRSTRAQRDGDGSSVDDPVSNFRRVFQWQVFDGLLLKSCPELLHASTQFRMAQRTFLRTH